MTWLPLTNDTHLQTHSSKCQSGCTAVLVIATQRIMCCLTCTWTSSMQHTGQAWTLTAVSVQVPGAAEEL